MFPLLVALTSVFHPVLSILRAQSFKLIWKNSKQIGAAWARRKDKRLVVVIKYNPGGNVIGYFKKNVLPPTASLLGPEWTRIPPKFARCPMPTKPYVKGSAGMVVLSLELFIGSFILATLIS